MTFPQINIYGAVIGTVVCYIIAACMNYYFVRKYTGVRMKFGEHLFKAGCRNRCNGPPSPILYIR